MSFSAFARNTARPSSQRLQGTMDLQELAGNRRRRMADPEEAAKTRVLESFKQIEFNSTGAALASRLDTRYMQEEIRRLTAKLEQQQLVIQNLREGVTERDALLGKASTELQGLRETNAQLHLGQYDSQRIQDLERALFLKDELIKQLQAQVLQQDSGAMNSIIERQNERIDALQAELQALRETTCDAATLAECSAQNKILESQNQQFAKFIALLRAENESRQLCDDENSRLKATVAQQKQEIGQLQRENNLLRFDANQVELRRLVDPSRGGK